MSKRSRRPAARELVVGFVCEGSTDVVVLRRFVEAVLGDIDARTLQPETDELDRQLVGTSSGWSEVRAWCQRVTSLDEYFDPDIGDPIDLLVIALDLDIAIRAGITKHPDNLRAYDAKQLCDIVKSWLPARLPGRVIIAIPVMAIEAWVLAAMFPRMTHLEAGEAPAAVLVERGKIEMGRNGPWKRVTNTAASLKPSQSSSSASATRAVKPSGWRPNSRHFVLRERGRPGAMTDRARKRIAIRLKSHDILSATPFAWRIAVADSAPEKGAARG